MRHPLAARSGVRTTPAADGKRQEVTVMRKIKVQKNRNYLGTLLG
ncbi:hypothetical protein GCM10009544_44110 [Streptomyces stramineus]|uniref:Transposase n=1 Tax=Streptomyces stramineus TaxID=173861 RepID=A0ABP3KDS1_9ACTN